MKPRVLIVDDSPTIRKVVSGILERNGYETVAAFDGQRALEILEQSDLPFDVALVDFVMPRMNGFQFCRGLRERPALRDLPVVLMSARTEKIRDQFVQQTGAVGAISKPFTPQDLLEVVRASSTRQASDKARAQPSRGPATGHGEVMLEGNLVHVPIGAVLQMLQVEQLSGVLYVTEGPRTIVLAMTDGLIDFAYAENAGSEFRLGRMLVEQGILTKEQIDVAVAHQSAAAPPMPPPQAAGVLGAGSSDKQKRPPMGSIPVEKMLQESPAMAYRAPAQTLLDLVEVASDAPEPLPEPVRRPTPPPPNPTGVLNPFWETFSLPKA